MLGYCVRGRKNALLIRIGVENVWENVDLPWMNGSWAAYLASPADFLKGRMTSQRRESLGSISSNTSLTFDYYKFIDVIN